MANLNVTALSGRLTKDPELKTTQSGKQVTSFTLAVNGYREDDTSFIEVTAWAKTAEVVTSYTKKGDILTVSGRLQQRRFEDKDGKSRSVVEVIADNVQLPPKGSTSDNSAGIPDEAIDLSTLDIPF